jgi:RNA polymerase sigma-70 factor (ECF subfamily)
MNPAVYCPRPGQKRYSPDDDELIKAVAEQRSEDALATLYHRYAARLHGVASQVLGGVTDSDDVLQETLIHIWRDAGNYDPGKGMLLGWMVTIARRRALDRLRRISSRVRATRKLEHVLASSAAEAGLPEWGSESHGDLAEVLEKHIRALPAAQGAALRLAYFKGLSHSQIAMELQVPLGTVKTRLDLAVKKLGKSVRKQ